MSDFSNTFRLYSKYYDLIYRNKNYNAEVNYIHKLLNKFIFGKKNLLEFGSGTGKHAKFFVKKGYRVHGIETSSNMINMSHKINGFTIQQGDIRKIKLKTKHDIILSLFHVASYQVRPIDINGLFSNARYHLKSNGIFGFDFWYSAAVNSQKPKIKLIELKKKNFKIIRLAEPEVLKKKKIINVNYTILVKNILKNTTNVIREKHSMRHFSLSDLKKLCKRHRFKCLHVRELVSNNKPSKNTWGIFCLLKKY
jgi:SAM-dependent methyltransferase